MNKKHNPQTDISYWIFTNKRGERIAYKSLPATYNKYLALYGKSKVPVVKVPPPDVVKIYKDE